MAGRKIDTSALHKDTVRHRSKMPLSLQLERAEHRNRILNLTRSGADPEQISELLLQGTPPVDVTPSEIKAFLKRYLNKIHTEDALTIEEMRVLENSRIDRLWQQLSAQVRNPDGTPNLKVVDRMTRLSERRSRMNGFEAAQRHEHVVFNGLSELGLEEDLIESGKQRWIESGGEDDPAEGIIDAEVVEVDNSDAT